MDFPRERAVLCLVQAAVLGGATRVDVSTGRLGTEMRFDGELPDVAHLWDGLDAGTSGREAFRRRQLALGVGGCLARFPSRVEVDGWAFHSRGRRPHRIRPPGGPLHRIAVWRLGSPDAEVVAAHTGFGHPEVRVNGILASSHTCTGLPSLGATNSRDPAVTLDSLKRHLHLEVPLEEGLPEVSVLMALGEHWPGRLTVVCAGVRVAELTGLAELPGVRGQVTVPFMDLDPATVELSDPRALLPLVQDVWLRGVCLPWPRAYRDRLYAPLRWLLRQENPTPALRRLLRVRLVPTVRGLWSLQRCRREKPLLRGRDWEVEPLLEEAGIAYGYRDDDRTGVNTSARKRAVRAWFLDGESGEIPLHQGTLHLDLARCTATEDLQGQRTTLTLDRVETGQEVRCGDTSTTTWHYLLLAEGDRSLVYKDYDRVTAEGGGSCEGVGEAVARLAHSLRASIRALRTAGRPGDGSG